MTSAAQGAESPRRLLLSLLWRERRWAGAMALCSIVGAALEGLGIGLLIPLLQSITDPTAAPLASGIGWVDRWVLAVDAAPLDRLTRVSGAILASIVLRSGLVYGAQVASTHVTENVLDRIRRRVFAVLTRAPLRFVAGSRAGDLLNTATAEVQRLRYLFSVVTQIVVRGLLGLAYVALALWLSWTLTVVALGSMVVLSLGLRRVVARTRDRGRTIADANGLVSAVAAEAIGGARTVRAFGAEAFERDRFAAASVASRDQVVRAGTSAAIVRPLGEALASGVLIGLVVVSVRLLVAGGSMTVPTLLAFLFALFRMLPIVHELNQHRGLIASLQGSWEHIVSFLSDAATAPLPSGADAPGPLRDALRVEAVSFAYEPGAPVLHDVTLTVGRGQTVALVGASGAGKSTLVDLAARFMDPTAGAVSWDGVDLRDLDLAALRTRMAVVSQETFLFHDTAAANIAYGDPAPSRERVVEAARRAHALAFLEAFPDGLETVLGDRGVRLSGGQRQRIAIARALYRDPEVLLLDEATSALDSVSERLIQASLDELMAGRTAVVVAHRLSTIEAADLVVVLEEGRIVEQGTYDELVARQGALWEFHRLQNQPVPA